MNNTCVIWNAGNRWIVQAGIEVIGEYQTLRGARIGATKMGFIYATY